MYVYVYIYVHVCVYVNVFVYVCIYIYACVHVYVYAVGLMRTEDIHEDRGHEDILIHTHIHTVS